MIMKLDPELFMIQHFFGSCEKKHVTRLMILLQVCLVMEYAEGGSLYNGKLFFLSYFLKNVNRIIEIRRSAGSLANI